MSLCSRLYSDQARACPCWPCLQGSLSVARRLSPQSCAGTWAGSFGWNRPLVTTREALSVARPLSPQSCAGTKRGSCGWA